MLSEAWHVSKIARQILCVLTASVLSCFPLTAQSATLKSNLEKKLLGKVLVSKIIIGGKGIPPGYSGAYPVNTLIYPDKDNVVYRVEWGLIRGDAGPNMERFNAGTSFRVTAVEPKDDRLELKPKSPRDESANVKLMLGAGWQAKFNFVTSYAELGQVFVLEEPPQEVSSVAGLRAHFTPEANTPKLSPLVPSPNGGGQTASTVAPGASRPGPPTVQVSEARATPSEFSELLHQAEQERVRAGFTAAIQNDGNILSRIVQIYARSSPHAAPIENMRSRLGKDFRPQSPDDVRQMLAVYTDCWRSVQAGPPRQYTTPCRSEKEWREMMEEIRKHYPPWNAFPTAVEHDLAESEGRAAEVQGIISEMKASESALDGRNYEAALAAQNQLRAAFNSATVSFLVTYLQTTAGIFNDLQSYSSARMALNQYDNSTPATAVRRLTKAQQLQLSSGSLIFTSEMLKTEIDLSASRIREFIDSADKAVAREDFAAAIQIQKSFREEPASQGIAFLADYFVSTRNLYADLQAYVSAQDHLAHLDRLTLLGLINRLAKAMQLLGGTKDAPRTQATLQREVAEDTESVRQRLASLPAFQFDETSYRIRGALPGTTSPNLSDRLTFVESRITDLDNRLGSVYEVQAIIAQPEAMKTVEQVFGGNEAAKLKATAIQIAAAERVRATLVEAQNSIQASIAAENEARERRTAAEQEAQRKRLAAENERQAELARAFEGAWLGFGCNPQGPVLAVRATIVTSPLFFHIAESIVGGAYDNTPENFAGIWQNGGLKAVFSQTQNDGHIYSYTVIHINDSLVGFLNRSGTSVKIRLFFVHDDGTPLNTFWRAAPGLCSQLEKIP